MNVLIIEDEQPAAQRLEKMIQKVDATIQVIAQLDSIESVLEWWSNNSAPDLLFLDIHLADGSAFEIFNRLNIAKPIIFTTAYDQYAMQAFKVNAVDYLLKPIKINELKSAIEKYKSLQSTPTFDYAELAKHLHSNPPKNLKRFLIRVGQNLKTVEIEDVAYFYTENKITFLIAKEGKRYPIDFSLEKLEEELDDTIFFRINRQFIIRVESITKMVSVSKSRVKLYLHPANKETIVSTERSGKFKKWLVGE